MDQNIDMSFFMPFLLFGSIVGIVEIIALWKIYEKAGQPGWKAIIPFYNAYILLKIVGKPGWWFLLMCIPIVNIIYLIWTYNMLSKSFGKDEGFTVGILFLGFIFLPILGFGKAVYHGPYGNKAAFDEYQGRYTLDAERDQPGV
jgi:Family of unknown function (DUF5684)